MAETIKPVEGVAYTANTFDDIFAAMLGALGYNPATMGPLRYNPWGRNTLAVSGAASPVAVASGDAIVNGKLYTNTASKNITVSTPAAATRIDRVVLRIDYTASPMTCTAVLLAGAEGGAAPALTQTDGTTWEVSLAQVSITTGGVITLTDERVMVGDLGTTVYALGAAALAASTLGRAVMQDGYFDAATVLAKFAESSLTTANLRWLVGADQVTNAVLLDLVLNGAFQADAGTRALFADNIWTADQLAHSIDAQPIAFNADTVDGSHAADIISGGVIVGAILMWSGTLGGTGNHHPVVGATPNTDWHICNGDTVGGIVTPDLRDRFIVGAGTTYAVGDTGGATTSSHTHAHGTLHIESHTHTLTSGSAGMGIPSAAETVVNSGGTTVNVASGSHTHALSGSVQTLSADDPETDGSTAASAPNNLPPYYGLYYIMKVS